MKQECEQLKIVTQVGYLCESEISTINFNVGGSTIIEHLH